MMKQKNQASVFSVKETAFPFVRVWQAIVGVKPQKVKLKPTYPISVQSKTSKPKLSILGCRGIPAKYGGFETFAERLALYLTRKGWEVTVYCQANNSYTEEVFETSWQGIRLVQIPVYGETSLATMIFDWKSTLHVLQEKNLILILGYNTAIFCILYRLNGLTNLINMDGLEWCRQKWSLPEKAWLYLNERLGCWLGNHLIADHPEIKKHLATRVSSEKITVIPYGSEEVTEVDASLLKQYELVENEYALVIARPEPENNILEIVSAFCCKTRGIKLVILGCYCPELIPYHKKVIEAANDEVKFLGANYECSLVRTLRFYAKLYVHGHTVGGTNPSLVEALAAGSPILAHQNKFNYWVAGVGNHYFKNQEDCQQKLNQLLPDTKELQQMKKASIKRYYEEFSAEKDVKLHEDLLTQYWVKSTERVVSRRVSSESM